MTPGKAWYLNYLKSDHWRDVRARMLARAHGLCEKCGIFCGVNPHGPDEAPCFDDECGYCSAYYDPYDGVRNEDDIRGLDIHHITYARVGAELDSDLLVLCEVCHDHITDVYHDLLPIVRSKSVALSLAHDRKLREEYMSDMWGRMVRAQEDVTQVGRGASKPLSRFGR